MKTKDFIPIRISTYKKRGEGVSTGIALTNQGSGFFNASAIPASASGAMSS